LVARAVKLKAKNGARLSTLVPSLAMADGVLKWSLLLLIVQIAGELGFDFLNRGEAALELRREGLGELGFPILVKRVMH
jgi:hypothetical protein